MPEKWHTNQSLLLLTIVYVLLLVAGGSKLSAAFHIPHESSVVASYMATNGWAIQWGSFCELASALVLGVFMAMTVSRLGLTGMRSAGAQVASLGSIGATMMLAFSGLASWSLTRPGVAEAAGAVSVLQALMFDGGGPGFAVFLGLFLAGVSIVAGQRRLLPRWLIWLGVAVAVACELASLTLLTFKAGYFIPVGRFISIIWMIGVSLQLPASIGHERREGELSGVGQPAEA